MTGPPGPRQTRRSRAVAVLFKTTGKYRQGGDLIRVKSAHF